MIKSKMPCCLYFQVTHLVLDTTEKLESYKCRQARKLSIPIISSEYVTKCVEEERLLTIKGFLMEKSVTSQKFEKGKIAGKLMKGLILDVTLIVVYDLVNNSAVISDSILQWSV